MVLSHHLRLSFAFSRPAFVISRQMIFCLMHGVPYALCPVPRALPNLLVFYFFGI